MRFFGFSTWCLSSSRMCKLEQVRQRTNTILRRGGPLCTKTKFILVVMALPVVPPFQLVEVPPKLPRLPPQSLPLRVAGLVLV